MPDRRSPADVRTNSHRFTTSGGCGTRPAREVTSFSGERTDLPVAPTADFTYAPSWPSVGDSTNTIVFEAEADDDAGITSWTWEFGDAGSGAANSATGEQAAHHFGQPGTYAVTLVVTDSEGLVDSKIKLVTVRP